MSLSTSRLFGRATSSISRRKSCTSQLIAARCRARLRRIAQRSHRAGEHGAASRDGRTGAVIRRATSRPLRVRSCRRPGGRLRQLGAMSGCWCLACTVPLDYREAHVKSFKSLNRHGETFCLPTRYSGSSANCGHWRLRDALRSRLDPEREGACCPTNLLVNQHCHLAPDVAVLNRWLPGE